MTSIYMLLLLLTVISMTIGKAVFLTVHCQAETLGEIGQHSLLQCVVQSIDKTATIRVVTWWKRGADNVTLVFKNGEIKQKPGYMFGEVSWNNRNMNVSMLITNTKVADAGDYKCTVITDSGDGIGYIKLKVKAKYSAPKILSNPEIITGNTAGKLVCDSSGGYPEGFIRWFVEGSAEETTGSKMEVKKTQSGLFHLSSELTLQGSILSNYTCAVFNAIGEKETEAIFKPQSETSEHGANRGLVPTSKIVASLVVIGSLITGLLLALLIYRRRSRPTEDHYQYKTENEQGIHMLDKKGQNQV